MEHRFVRRLRSFVEWAPRREMRGRLRSTAVPSKPDTNHGQPHKARRDRMPGCSGLLVRPLGPIVALRFDSVRFALVELG